MVAFMQYLRVVMVAAVAAPGGALFGVAPQHAGDAIVWFPDVAWLPLGETLALAVVGSLACPRPAHPGGRLPGAAGRRHRAHAYGLADGSSCRPGLLAGSYALVGWNVGLRFTRPCCSMSRAMLPRILLCTRHR